MNKAELAVKLSEKTGLPKKRCEEIVETIADLITEELKSGGEATIAGFGKFTSYLRASRMGVNPQKPSERMQIHEVRVPKFKAGQNLKKALKGK